jgi:hypothetical protein
MKLLRKKSAKAGKNAMNETVATDEAVQGVLQEPSTAKEEPSKAAKKKFGLFSKSKRKNASTPQKNATTTTNNNNKNTMLTPDTLIEVGNDDSYGDYDVHNLSSDHVVSIVPVGRQASPPGKLPVRTEEELHETLTWARSLLAELDMADADAGSDEEAEGTELILPSPKYEVGNDESVDEKDKVKDTVVKDEPAIEKKTVETEKNEKTESEGQPKPTRRNPQKKKTTKIQPEETVRSLHRRRTKTIWRKKTMLLSMSKRKKTPSSSL